MMALAAIIQGVILIVIANLYSCSEFQALENLLLGVGGLTILSALFSLRFRITVGNWASAAFNVLQIAILVGIVWIATLTWPHTDRLWDGGANCDGFIYSFSFIFTVVAAFEFCCLAALRLCGILAGEINDFAETRQRTIQATADENILL